MNDVSEPISGNQWSRDRQLSQSIVRRLEFYFATLTVLGGFILVIGQDAEVIPIVAIFFGIVGYLFVDVMKLFALPPTAAYIAMAVAAVVCIVDFADRESVGPRQLLAVAHLLVLVQAILMMQRKSKRIFEQLAIFCLLELIVAAVFNDAISFGMMLIPITLIGATSLGMLAAIDAIGIENTNNPDDPFVDVDDETNAIPSAITIFAGESTRAAKLRANQLSRNSIAMFAPAILSVAMVFFYALPRTSEASRASNRGDALVGFNDHVQLKQIGQMLQNPAIALHVKLTDRSTGESYQVNDDIYLRGRVLERYEVNHDSVQATATWNALPIDGKKAFNELPQEYFSRRFTDANFYDTVNATIVCEQFRSDSLFVIAPYHRAEQNRNVIHLKDRWTIRRRESGDWIHPQIEYSFGTNAFHRGVQSNLIGRAEVEHDDKHALADYRRELLKFDPGSMPTIAKIADGLSKHRDGSRLSNFEIARSIERHFAFSPDYRYTLNLNTTSIENVDPIERFVSADRAGHCQYFASAMAMMLRSQNIPARVVVGYRTSEYNEWTDQYIARQLHAHAWVEGLFDRDQISDPVHIYGQPDSEQYWYRLDPTPSASQSRQEAGTIRQSIDLAQGLWDDYVVDMDANQQQGSSFAGRIQPSGQWYDQAVNWLSRQMRRIQAGDLGGGALAGQEFSKWPLVVAGIGLMGGIILLVRLRHSIRRKSKSESHHAASRPTIEFYATALDQLARLGIFRRRGETPTEFAKTASIAMQELGGPPIEAPMERLTTTFYRHRFGGRTESRIDSQRTVDSDLASIQLGVETILSVQAERNQSKPARQQEEGSTE